MTPPTKITIPTSDLKAGDILLCSTTDSLSKLIQEVDQGGYSHTMLYVGLEENEPMIVHATTKGIRYQKLSDISDRDEIDLISAFRYKDDDGKSPGDPGFPVQPIVDNAKSYVGGPYFFSELILGGLVILSVDQFKSKTMQKVVRVLGGLIEHGIAELFKKNTGKAPMVCVQVATTAYWNADAQNPGKYGIKVKIDGTRKHVPLVEDKELNALKLKLHSEYEHYQKLTVNPVVGDDPFIAKAGSPLIPLGTCTLRDMSTSPSLDKLGDLKNTRSDNA